MSRMSWETLPVLRVSGRKSVQSHQTHSRKGSCQLQLVALKKFQNKLCTMRRRIPVVIIVLLTLGVWMIRTLLPTAYDSSSPFLGKDDILQYHVPGGHRAATRQRLETAVTDLWHVLDPAVTSILETAGSSNTAVLSVVDKWRNELDGYRGALVQALAAYSDLEETLQVPTSPPSAEREAARRGVERTATELWYFVDAGMRRLTNVTSREGDEAVSDAVSRLGHDLVGRITSMQRAINDVRSLDEEWRVAESNRLGDLVQRRLEYIQNPEDCSRTKLIHCDMKDRCGFGCQLHHLGYCLLVAYATKRTLVADDSGFLSREWRTFFKPLSTTCTQLPRKPVPQWNQATWKAQLEKAQAIHMPSLFKLGKQGLRPDFFPMAIPADLGPRLTTFHGYPFVWWLGQALRYLIRPNTELTRQLNATASRLGFKNPIAGIHIRRTDKLLLEAPTVHGLDEYMRHVTNYFRWSHPNMAGSERRVYLATDDPDILKSAKDRYPDFTFISDNAFSRMAAVNTRSREEATLGIIMDILLLAQSDFIVCTFSSNVGRAVYELMQTRHGDASNFYRSLDDVYFFHSQNPHNLTATDNHTAPENTTMELSVHTGDVLKARGNYKDGTTGNNFEGWTNAYNWRTGKTGMVPSYKVRDNVAMADMPTYSQVTERGSVAGQM